MPKIVFLCDHVVKDEERTSYKCGQVLECNEASAEHFIRRDLAKLHEEPEPPKAKGKVKTKSEVDDVIQSD